MKPKESLQERGRPRQKKNRTGGSPVGGESLKKELRNKGGKAAPRPRPGANAPPKKGRSVGRDGRTREKVL